MPAAAVALSHQVIPLILVSHIHNLVVVMEEFFSLLHH